MTAPTVAGTVTDAQGKVWNFSAQAVDADPEPLTAVGGSVLKQAGETMVQACQRLDGIYGDAGHKWTPRIYLSSPPSAASWTNGSIPTDRPVVVTWVGDSGAATGTFDAQLTGFFQAAPTQYPIFYGRQQEPEDDYTTAAQKAAYIADWRHVVELQRAVADRPNLLATLILMDWTADAGSHRDWHDWYPGAAYLDVLAWDQYAYQNGSGGLNSETTKQLSSNRPTAAISHGEGLLYAVGEFGCKFEQTPPIPDSVRAPWLEDTAATMEANDAAFVCLFDTNKGGTFNIEDHPTLVAAWRSVVTG